MLSSASKFFQEQADDVCRRTEKIADTSSKTLQYAAAAVAQKTGVSGTYVCLWTVSVGCGDALILFLIVIPFA